MHDHDGADALILRVHVLINPVTESFCGNRVRLVENHRGEWCLAPFFAGNTEHRGFADGRMLDDDFLDVLGKDIVPIISSELSACDAAFKK